MPKDSSTRCTACAAPVARAHPHGFCDRCHDRAIRGRRRFMVACIGLGVIRPERLTEAIVAELEREAN